MPVVVKHGNILDFTERYMMHQCNRRTTYAKGLAAAIFAKWPVTDTYKGRIERTPQDMDVIRIQPGQSIVNAYIQEDKGKAKDEREYEDRLQTLSRVLHMLRHGFSDATEVAIPWNMGCGLAGGNVEDYHVLIDAWAMNPANKVTVVYYKDD